MYWSACLFLEVVLCFEGDVNLITMARRTLGRPGEGVAWLGFLLLLYSLLAAYMAGSAPLFAKMYSNLVGSTMPFWLAPFPIIVMFGPFVYLGLRFVDYINRYLMIGLILTYVSMVMLLTPSVDGALLLRTDTDFALLSFAVVITSFGYHIIIPSLTNFLDRDIGAVKRCIILGSFFPLLIYVIWEVLILGNIPVGGNLGIAALTVSSNADAMLSESLALHLNNSVIAYGIDAFGLFAIITSFLGVAQSLFDFLRDGLKMPSTHKGRMLVWLLTFTPPLMFVLVSQKGFVAVLEYAGVFIAILIGFVPIMMTWSARYVKNLKSPYVTFGGKPALVLGFLAYVFIIVLVFAKNSGHLGGDVTKYLS